MSEGDNVRERKVNGHAKNGKSNGHGTTNGNGLHRNASFNTKKDAGYLREFNNSLAQIKFDKSSYHLTRVVLVRYLAFIYFVAFLVAFNQNKELMGKSGLRPANRYMDRLVRDLSKTVSPNDEQDIQALLKLTTGSEITVRGKVEGITLRPAIVLSPAELIH